MYRALEQGGSTGDAIFEGAAHLIGKSTGAEMVVESYAGIDLVSAQQLSQGERIERGVIGGAQLLLTAFGGAKWLTSFADTAVEKEVAGMARSAAPHADEACGTVFSCFLAGTDVLLGDGTTEADIETIHVGQRVATDGGVANSADGQTAEDPNATEVDPATWRLVTIHAADGDWDVQTLVPLNWIEGHHMAAGGSIALSQVTDVAEMGVPDGLTGTVESISACPPIETGTGRVVLTTVSHLNDFVFDLTLSDSQGNSDNLGVTGYHKFYTEDRGWVSAIELTQGEVVRTAYGDATVTGLVRNPGTFRVYNMTVEADHVYYVGDLTALVHNTCNPLRSAMERAGVVFDEGEEAAHIVPRKLEHLHPKCSVYPQAAKQFRQSLAVTCSNAH